MPRSSNLVGGCGYSRESVATLPIQYRERNRTLQCVTHATHKVANLQHTTQQSLVVIPRRLLTVWNITLFVFHSLFATATISLGKLDLTGQMYKTSLHFSWRDVNNTAAGWDITPIYATGGNIPLTILTASFFLVSALFHLLNASFLREYYLSELEQCRSPTRWMEYFISAPIMIVVIAYTLGVREENLILALAALVAITMPFGYWVETVSRPYNAECWSKPFSQRILPWWIGHLPQIVTWYILVSQFYKYHHDVDNDSESRAPWFVHLILWGEIFLFSSFAFASLLSQWGGPSQFYKGELLFQMLSLTSKGLLGAILLTSVLMLSSFEDIYS